MLIRADHSKEHERKTDLASIGPDLFLLHDSTGRVIRAGSNAERVVGLDAELLRDRGFIDSVHVHDRVAVAQALNDSFANAAPRKAQFRFAAGTASRDDRWFELRCEIANELDDGCNPAPLLSVVRDISRRRKLENELRCERERADSANVAKSRFLANMSHELRTPLNAILGFSELLQSDVMQQMPPERSQEYIALIHNSAHHLLNVLNDILDMSKIEAGKYEILTEPFDLGQTLRSSAAILRGQADKRGISISVGCFDGLPEINADERAIKQVMINLISNAVKFSHDHGEVRITARRSGRSIQIEVADDGIGISPEHLERLGQPFYQADSRYDRKYEGTGLGLSVVCGLVDLHAGKVEFHSAKDEGTSVKVTLPLVPPHQRPVPASEEVEIIRLPGSPVADDTALAKRSA